MQPSEHFAVRTEVETREVEEGKEVPVADVEEEVRRAAVVPVLEELRQGKLENPLVEVDGPLDVAREEREVVDPAS
jgi:hypothetical protein